MGHSDSLYRIEGTIELDDVFIRGKHKGKRGRGAEGKTPVIIASENRDKKAGFIAMKALDNINIESVNAFMQGHLLAHQYVKKEACTALNIMDKTQQHEPRVTPSSKVDEWLPWVHIAIENLKTFLLGTFHGVTKVYLQEYPNEFCHRFN